MVYGSVFKNTVLFLFIFIVSCGNSVKNQNTTTDTHQRKNKEIHNRIFTGAQNTQAYFDLIKNKKIGVVTNQTGVIIRMGGYYSVHETHGKAIKMDTLHLVDFLIKEKIDVTKIYAPEHGFRGTADAGELIKDSKDVKTGIPIISIYGNNKKPTAEQLEGIDVMLFDLQDVGARFFTYISTLHYIMEACAENNIPLIVLDRPNPNGATVDGPVLEKEHSSFIGMHPIPVLHGMTIGEYAKMINGEKWLKNGVKCNLTIAPCLNYNKNMSYSLPVRPSPNLPNDKSINLYASLCFFEGTNVSLGRGTEKQFQIYGSPFLPNNSFSFIPKPNFGSKDPLHNGKVCYGEDLSNAPDVKGIELKWLLKAYNNTTDKSKFFIPFFSKLAGTKKLQQQIEDGMNQDEIKRTWTNGIETFKKTRAKYLIYTE